MRPSFICRLVLTVLLSAGAAHAQPFASPQSTAQPPRKSAALTSKTAFKADPFRSMAKAILVIGGVEEPAQQQHYLAYLKLVEGQCKQAVAGTHSARKRAEVLGKFLLKGPLRSGYVSGQSDFIRTLNDGTFNTVLGNLEFNDKGDVTLPGYVFYEWKSGKYDYLQ